MMRLINNQKNKKFVSLFVAVIFLLGIGAIAYTQMLRQPWHPMRTATLALSIRLKY